MTKTGDAPGPPLPSTVSFGFIKSNDFRVLHVDGAWGGATPHGLISVAVYSERFPIPKAVTVDLSDGKLGNEVAREVRDGVVREVSANLVMTMEVAESLRDFLEKHIANLKKLREEAAK